MEGSNAFGKTICSICYEDLKPMVEDLQAISICGHVFHELCLQQWLEYCNGKKSTCPVCKQKCCQENVSRLYFQSLGDSTDLTQKISITGEGEEDPRVLRREVKKLEGKLSGLNLAFERQQQDLKEVTEELGLCKEHTKKETILKNEALQQKTLFQQMLQSKSEELGKTLSECSRLQERNLALAKELAALKLVSDLNLEEDEVVKLASFGHGVHSADTVDVLKKSLVIRNKSYKELMAQCNLLGRGESRTHKKLEKAKEKMKQLKTRVQELEVALEVKDNEVLRALKVSKRTSREGADLNGINSTSAIPCIKKCPTENQMKHSPASATTMNQSGGSISHRPQFRKTGGLGFHNDDGTNTYKEDTGINDIDSGKHFSFMADGNTSGVQSAVHDHTFPSLKPQTNVNFDDDVAILQSSARTTLASDRDAGSPILGQSSRIGILGSDTGRRDKISNNSFSAMEEDVIRETPPSSAVETVLIDDTKKDLPLLNIRNEAAHHVSTANRGEQCFAGGVIGPDGGNRYLGKWCKRAQTNTSVSSSSVMQGDLISIGADGRGGRIKVLRTESQEDSKVTPRSLMMSKRFKYGGKQSGQQSSQGCLQIEHFFGKTFKATTLGTSILSPSAVLPQYMYSNCARAARPVTN